MIYILKTCSLTHLPIYVSSLSRNRCPNYSFFSERHCFSSLRFFNEKRLPLPDVGLLPCFLVSSQIFISFFGLHSKLLYLNRYELSSTYADAMENVVYFGGDHYEGMSRVWSLRAFVSVFFSNPCFQLLCFKIQASSTSSYILNHPEWFFWKNQFFFARTDLIPGGDSLPFKWIRKGRILDPLISY